MKKKTKIILIVFVSLICIGFSGYYYVMNAGERNLETETAEFSVNSKSISEEFSSNIGIANKKYLEKAVAVSGKITSINNNEIILDNNVICNLKNIDKSLQINQNIVLKGRIVGYDDLMGELKLDQCFINQ